jgi:hypothetical protein
MEQAVAQSPVSGRTRGDGVRFELATRADDAEIRRLLRENPMPGRISISLEREPDASLAAAVEGDVIHTIVARNGGTGRLIAMGSVSVRDVWLNGTVMRTGYLGQLRLDRRYRSRASIVIAGYRLFRELHDELGVELYLTSIASDNMIARRFLERGLPGMPTYRPLNTFVTSMIEACVTHPKPSPGLHVRPAELDDLPQILECLARNGQRHQFAPVWREDDLLERMRRREVQFIIATRRQRLVGCLAVWDQSGYKQAVIRGYDTTLMRWRKWINVASRFTPIPHLPPVGTTINMAYLSHLAIDDDDPNVFAGLLTSACGSGDRLLDDSQRRYFVLGPTPAVTTVYLPHQPLRRALERRARSRRGAG